MNHDQKPHGPPHPPAGDTRADGLSREQEEFARVVGRLLAHRWVREGPRPGTGATPVRPPDDPGRPTPHGVGRPGRDTTPPRAVDPSRLSAYNPGHAPRRTDPAR